ncbi:hypothetical protein, partial [Moorena sp. SIO2C4]|uniref:hypothetical protein n=1 Tax=Moorena sp. SIO2C4 TaxID=2607824 RepID=UPI00257F0552
IWFWSSPRGSPNFAVRPKGDLLALGGAHRKGRKKVLFPPSEQSLAWGARGAKPYPESATPFFLLVGMGR